MWRRAEYFCCLLTNCRIDQAGFFQVLEVSNTRFLDSVGSLGDNESEQLVYDADRDIKV